MSIVYFTGVLHIGMTTFFYVDPQLREYRRERLAVFVGWPLAVGVGAAVVIGAGPQLLDTAVQAAIALWLGWHYTGQQVGVVALTLKSESRGARLLTRERRLVRATAVVTMLGLLRGIDLSATPLRNLDGRWPSVVAFAGVCVALVAVLATGRAATPARNWTTKAVCLAWAVAFTAPFAVFANPAVAAATVATVHSAHYVFLVAYLSRARRQWAWVGSVASGAAVAAAYIVVLQVSLRGGVAALVAPAFLFTLVAAHRIVDARVWRLREPERLEYMRGSFGFL